MDWLFSTWVFVTWDEEEGKKERGETSVSVEGGLLGIAAEVTLTGQRCGDWVTTRARGWAPLATALDLEDY